MDSCRMLTPQDEESLTRAILQNTKDLDGQAHIYLNFRLIRKLIDLVSCSQHFKQESDKWFPPKDSKLLEEIFTLLTKNEAFTCSQVYLKLRQNGIRYLPEESAIILFDLLRTNHWKMKSLHIENLEISEEDIRKLVYLDWPDLEDLALCSNQLNESDFAILMESKWPKLLNLNLSDNELSEEMLERFGSKWRSLKFLTLCDIGLKQAKLPFLLNWSSLTTLNLSKNGISRKGVKSIVKAGLQHLRSLQLNRCGLDDECLIELSKGHWRLGHLQLTANYFTNRGYKYFSNGCWLRLEILTLKIDQHSINGMRHAARLEHIIGINKKFYMQQSGFNMDHEKLEKYFINELARLSGVNYDFNDQE